MVRSVYQTNEEKGRGRKEKDLSGYIVPGFKTIEVSRLRGERGEGRGENREGEDRQIFTRHKAVEQPLLRSSLLHKSAIPRRAKYIVMAIGKYEREKCTPTTRDLKNYRVWFTYDFQTLGKRTQINQNINVAHYKNYI